MKFFNQLKKALFELISGTPADSEKGRFWYDIISDVVKYEDNSAVREIINSDTEQNIENKAVITPTRLDPKPVDTKANAETYALTAINGELVFAQDEKRQYQVIDGKLKKIAGGGDGDLSIYKTIQADNEGLDNFDDAGLTNATLALESTSPISGEKSYKLTNATGAASEYFYTDEITLEPRQHGRTNSVSFVSEYDGADDDISVQVQYYNGSWADIAGVDALGLESNSTVVKSEIPFFIPSDATKIRLKVIIDVANNGKILQINDFQFSDNPYQYVMIGEENDFSARITSADVITSQGGLNESGQNAIAGVVSSSTGLYVLSYTTGFFGGITPSVVANAETGGAYAVPSSLTATGCTIALYNDGGALTNASFSVKISRQGADYRQQHEYVSTPAKAGSHRFEVHTTTSTGLTTTSGILRFGSLIVEKLYGSSQLSYSDDTGYFTALKPCSVGMKLGLRSASASTLIVVKNGSASERFITPTLANDNGIASGSFDLQVGDYVYFQSTAAYANGNVLSMDIVATPLQAEFMTAVPVPETCYINTSATTYWNQKTSSTAYKVASLISLGNPKSGISILSNKLYIPAGSFDFSVPIAAYNCNQVKFGFYDAASLSYIEEFAEIAYSPTTEKTSEIVHFSLVTTTPRVLEFHTKADNASGYEYVGRIKITKLKGL